jgi:2',3'-cyclic-nucleotide 2'-phosphodiesterase (5'-nucleotidase family)
MKTKLYIFFIAFFFISLSSCKQDNEKFSEKVKFTVLYTNDEHGWMEATDETGGAATMAATWKSIENNENNVLIISGGDMWTGPAISTWFRGISMVETMNAMGYDVAALGNHDFDFSVDTLRYRLANQMTFPVISANIIEKSTGNPPDFVKPFIVKEITGLKIGIIGLTTLSTPYTTFPENVKDYYFIPYADAVEKYAPKLKEQGADVIIIVGHICSEEMKALAPTAKKFNIPLITGGHCHERIEQSVNGVEIVESGANLENYVKVELEYLPETKSCRIVSSSIIPNTGTVKDEEVAGIVEKWELKVENALSEEIGYCSQTIDEKSVAMGNMVCDSWLKSFPDADIAITNQGGIRQDIPQGTINLKTIVGLLPFENSIVQLELKGSELIECIDNYLLGGMTTIGAYKLSDGSPIEADKTYKVLTTDYLYSADDEFKKYDDTPYNLSVNYRQPLIDWIKSLNTSSSNPLNNYLDNKARR